MADKPKTERELTYHVGWKKGKINCKDQSGSGGSPQALFFFKLKGQWQAFVEQMLWRDAPCPGDDVIRIFIYALPAVSFGAAVWLTYLLSNG